MNGFDERASLQTPLERQRLLYQPVLSPACSQSLTHGWQTLIRPLPTREGIARLFPHLQSQPAGVGSLRTEEEPRTPFRCGVVFSGGPAAGGHNVIWGLWQALQAWHVQSVVVGFENGPGGILQGQSRELTEGEILQVRNQGGFDLLGSGRTKIETPEQLDQALAVCRSLQLQGLVIIGGDDSNTNAALLAERALATGQALRVVGVPKTIDGDLRSADQPLSFGFDTATKVYSELIGNIARDARSARKYTHLIKLMGRSASHVTLECALQTQPNLALIGEEEAAHGTTLPTIVGKIVDWFIARRAAGRPYGVILVPEGLIEFLQDVGALIKALNQTLAVAQDLQEQEIAERLPAAEASLWQQIPADVRRPLLAQRDPHGNVPLSAFETERLLAQLAGRELQRRGVEDFSPAFHFLGYEGRCALPTDFDATFCFSLGWLAGAAVAHHLTGVLVAVSNPAAPPGQWQPRALPLVGLMDLEERHGKTKPVIRKALVDLEGPAFQVFQARRGQWAQSDSFRQPGPVQYQGGEALTWIPPVTLVTENPRA